MDNFIRKRPKLLTIQTLYSIVLWGEREREKRESERETANRDEGDRGSNVQISLRGETKIFLQHKWKKLIQLGIMISVSGFYLKL